VALIQCRYSCHVSKDEPLSRLRPLLVGALLSLLLSLASTAAFAQSSESIAAAQALFDEARQLVKEGDHAKACPKMAESNRLDPQVGTLLNLADCYANTGKLASAWVSFVEVANESAHGTRRHDHAKKRADELRPQLSYMVIEVEPVDGIEVTRNGQRVAEAMWGTKVPIDPGPQEINATAPGYRAWSDTISIDEAASEITVQVPALVAQSGSQDVAVTDVPTADAGDEGPSVLLIGGISLTGLGIAGAGMGIAFTVLTVTKNEESKDNCDPNDPNNCSQQGADIRDDAKTFQTVAIVSYAVGGAALLTGVALWVIAPPSSGGDEAASEDTGMTLMPLLSPGMLGVSAQGWW
jgi:hypothetical protein